MAQRASLAAILLLALCPLLSSEAQDLNTLDPAGYSGGYAADVSGPVGSEILYPYDSTEPWMHGYFQRMPFYGGYKAFRPYNYKHVLSQSQTAAGWGMSPKMPYSQQFWHRYHQQSQLMPMAASPEPHYPQMQAQNYSQPMVQAPEYQQPQYNQSQYLQGPQFEAPTQQYPATNAGYYLPQSR